VSERPSSLRVTAVQSELHWQDPRANRAHFDALLAQVSSTDLVVMPEMFATGFTMAPEAHAEPADGDTVQWLADWATRLGCVVAGSLAVRSDEGHFNRLYWMAPGGSALTYDKRHLFRMAGEHEHYRAGRERLIATIKGWRVCPLVCYDLRFPVWSRQRGDYDVLVYVANWPARRRRLWQRLLPARAIENQAYVVGVNRIGRDGAGIEYAGDSVILDPVGDVLAEAGELQACISATLQYEALEKLRQHFPVHLDADRFEIVE
jgi:omega-amidase